MIEITIPGEVVPLQSVRARIVTTKAGKQFIQFYQLAKTKKYKDYVVEQTKEQLPPSFMPMKGPLRLTVTASFSPPKSMSRNLLDIINSGGIVYKHTKPDITDNILKGVVDALEGVLYYNDSQISITGARKIYAVHPSVKITLEELPEYKGGTLL